MSTHVAAHASAVMNVTAEDAQTRPASEPFVWTWGKLCQSIVLFLLAAAAEVGGGWLIWQSIRSGRPWWWGLLGSVVLIMYGFIPTLQPVSHFARTFAVYGGFFIVYSYGWGWLLDHERPDTGIVHSYQYSWHAGKSLEILSSPCVTYLNSSKCECHH